MAGTAKPNDYVYNQLQQLEVINMSNVSIENEQARLWNSLDDERISRIAGDEANSQSLQQNVSALLSNESRLSTEVVQREEGDLRNINSLTELAKALSDYRIKTDLEINNEKIVREQLGIDLDSKINTYTSTFDHKFYLVHQRITDYSNQNDQKLSLFDERIKKYEEMLQDITTDSIQITMDNGEINMGAWTILSQAREWDLEILRGFKGFTAETEQKINEALEDFQNKLPIEQDIIDKAIEALSDSKVIKDLDAAIKDNGIKVAEVNEALITEAQRISNEIINMSQAKTNELNAAISEVQTSVNKEVGDRIDAVKRESEIRQQQINQQTADMNAELDERIGDLTTEVNDILGNAVTGFNQQVTELKNQDAYIINSLDTYKTVTDDKIAGVVNQTTVNTNNISTQANQLAAVQSTLGTKNRTFRQSSQPSSTGLVTGDTWINTTSGKNFEVKVWTGSAWTAVTDPRISANATNIANQSTQITNVQNGVTANTNSINALNVDIADIRTEAATFAKAKAVEDLTADVSVIDGVVKNHSTKITTLENTAEQLKDDIDTKATSAAFESLKSEVQITKDNVSSNTTKINQIDNSVTVIQGTIPTLATNAALESTNSSIQVEKGRIDNAVSRLNTMDTAIAGKANQSSLDTVSNRVTATENENTAQGNRLSTVEGSVNSLNNSVGANSSAISGLTNDVSAINQDLTAKAQRFDRIESNIRGLSLDTTPNLAQLNKWAFISVKKPYPYMSQAIVPDYSYLNKFVAYASTYLNEDGTLPSAAEYENAIHYFRTALYVNESKSITLSYFQGDDAHAVYLNNELLRTETGVAASALTLNLKQGWNLLDVIANNGSGPGGFSYGPAIQTLVDRMAATRLINVDQDANASATQALSTRVSSNEQAIATKAESSAVTNLQAQVNQNKADAAQTYVTKADNNQSEAALGNQLTAAYKAADADVVNTAAYDATVKANQAYNDSKAYVEQYAYGKASADQAVAGAIANYNTQLIIGANNLFTGTQEWAGTWTNIWAYELTNDYYKGLRILRTASNWSGVRQDIVYDENVQYTLSAWIKKSQSDVGIHFWGDNLTGDSGAGTQKPMEPGVWTRVTHTFKGTGQVGTARFEKIDNGSTGTYDICGLKVERGNKATDWSPNPKDEVNALVLGGRNLFTKSVQFQLYAGASNAYREGTGFVVTGVNNNDAVLRLWGMNMPVGIYTVSFDHKIDVGYFDLWLDAGDGPDVHFIADSGKGWQHFELQLYLTNSNNPWIDINGLTGQPHTFKNFKVERGNKATDYTPAPEDVANDINKVQANLSNFQEAQANVDLAQTNRLNSAESQLGANAARITNVEQTYATRDGVAALARNALQAEWQTYANDSVNNLQIGSENLILNSSFEQDFNGWMYNGNALDIRAIKDSSSSVGKAYCYVETGSGGSGIFTGNKLGWVEGQVYTLSGYFRNVTHSLVFGIEDATEVTGTSQVQAYGADNIWRKHTVVLRKLGSGGAVIAYLNNAGKFDVRGIKLEIGSKATTWSPASEDIVASLNAFKSTAETIYSTKAEANSTTSDIINRLTSKANQSGLDALSADVANNYYTKAQTDSVTAGAVNRYKAELGSIINYTIISRGNESGGVGQILDAKGNSIVNGGRSYTLTLFKADGTVDWGKNYDIYGNDNHRNDFLNDVTNIPNGTYVVVFTSDEPANGRDDRLFNALRMLGGTREVNDKLTYRGEYLLIGRKGMVESTAVELVAPAGQTITYGLQFVNGVPVGIGNTAMAMPSQFASASAVQNIQTEVSNLNGQVSSQAYSITELRSDLDKVGSAGPNLLKNSDFSNRNTDYWGWENTDNVYVANNLNWEYALSSAGDSRYVVAQGWNSMELYQFVPIEGNKIYQVSAHVASHRSSVKIYVSWWGKDMSYLGYTGENVSEWSKNGDGAPQAVGGSNGLVGTRRIYQNNIAPPNAYYMKVTLGRSAGDDPYMWATRLNAVEINSLTTPIIPWGESGAGLGVRLTDTAQVVDGVKAVRTTSIDNNGFISGYGLISELVNGIVQSAFGVNADYFYVGTSDGNKKKPFMVLTSPQVINGVSYPAGTWMDVALIANATIGTAMIANAAITSAQIAEAAITDAHVANMNAAKINAGILDAARIGARTITAEKLTVDAIDAISIQAREWTVVAPNGTIVKQQGSLYEVRNSSNNLLVRMGEW